MRNLGEARFREICEQFGLSADDTKLMNQLMTQWKQDYALDDIITLCEDYKDRPNIGQVMRAWFVIAKETAEISEFRRQGRNN